MATTGRFTGYGRPVLTGTTTGPLPRLRVFKVPGTDRHFKLRDGAVGFLIIHMVTWWHRNIGRIDVGVWDEWGHNDRPVRGTEKFRNPVWSEHAAGAAADVNATLHPRNVAIRRTFKAWQVSRILARLLMYRTRRGVRVLGWGGLFTRNPDGMHIEWARGASLADAEQVARRLMGTKIGRDVLAANPGLRRVIES